MKKYIIFFLCFMAIFAFGACGNNAQEEPLSSAQETVEVAAEYDPALESALNAMPSAHAMPGVSGQPDDQPDGQPNQQPGQQPNGQPGNQASPPNNQQNNMPNNQLYTQPNNQPANRTTARATVRTTARTTTRATARTTARTTAKPTSRPAGTPRSAIKITEAPKPKITFAINYPQIVAEYMKPQGAAIVTNTPGYAVMTSNKSMEELIDFYQQLIEQNDVWDIQIDDTQEGIWKFEGVISGKAVAIELREESKNVRIIISY